jgi:hypothetical protein
MSVSVERVNHNIRHPENGRHLKCQRHIMKANILTCPDSKGKIAGETLLLEKI